MKINISELVQNLQGTGDCIDEEIEENLTDADWLSIGNSIFKCHGCGWWVEIQDQAEDTPGEQICKDCDEQD